MRPRRPFQDAARAWPKWQKDAERLSGGQVFKMASALQVSCRPRRGPRQYPTAAAPVSLSPPPARAPPLSTRCAQVLHAKLEWAYARLAAIGGKAPLLHNAQRQAIKVVHVLDMVLEAHGGSRTVAPVCCVGHGGAGGGRQQV